MKELVLIIISYLIGSIPTALLVSKKFFGIDITALTIPSISQ